MTDTHNVSNDYINKIQSKVRKFYSELSFDNIFEQKQSLLEGNNFNDSEIVRINKIADAYPPGSLEYDISRLPITIVNRSNCFQDSQRLGWFNVNHDMDFLLSYSRIKEPWRVGLLERESIDKTIRDFVNGKEHIITKLHELLPEFVDDVDFLFYRIDENIDFLTNISCINKVNISIGPIVRDSIILIDKLLTTLVLGIPCIQKLNLENTQSVFSRPFLLFLAEMQFILFLELSSPDIITFHDNSLFYSSTKTNINEYELANFFCRHLIMHGNYPASKYSIPKNIWKSISFFRGLINLEYIFKASATSSIGKDIFMLLELYINTIKP